MTHLNAFRKNQTKTPGTSHPTRGNGANSLRVRLKYIVEDVDRHGNVRVYFRRKGQHKTRLPGLPGSDEFMAAYKRALAGMKSSDGRPRKAARATKGSFKWLCEEYFGSAEFKQLEDKTQLLRRRLLDKVSISNGEKPVNRVEPLHIRRLRDELADRPEA